MEHPWVCPSPTGRGRVPSLVPGTQQFLGTQGAGDTEALIPLIPLCHRRNPNQVPVIPVGTAAGTRCHSTSCSPQTKPSLHNVLGFGGALLGAGGLPGKGRGEERLWDAEDRQKEEKAHEPQSKKQRRNCNCTREAGDTARPSPRLLLAHCSSSQERTEPWGSQIPRKISPKSLG